jgi:excisionase family DNA binding protein
MNVDTQELVGDGALSVAEACEFLSIGRSLAYGLMDRGALRFAKIGRRRVIPKNELCRILAEGLSDGHSRLN